MAYSTCICTQRQILAGYIASFLDIDLDIVLQAFIESYDGHFQVSDDENHWEPELPLTVHDLEHQRNANTFTYAELKLEVERYGFPVFYELLPLDEALAEEESAIESGRDIFGDDFDAHQASQLDRVRSIHAAGYAAGTAYSVRAPTGEGSSAILLAELTPLSREQFDAARASGWLNPGGRVHRSG